MTDRDEIFSKLNSGMIAERGRAFRNNLEKNLPLIKRYGGLGPVVQGFSGKHVILIGAGPSLDRNIGLLKKFSGLNAFLLFSVDMALKPLLAEGITPDFVITCEATPVDFFSGIETSGMRLLAFSCSSPSNLRKWGGKMSFFNWMMNGEFYESLWALAGNELGAVATGSTVLTQAVSIALGCDVASLLLLANDMGFYDRFYASGTVGSLRRYLFSTRFNTHPAIDMNTARGAREYEIRRNGRIYYTNSQFLAARYWLDDLFGRAPYPVADCSLPGCSPSTVTKIDFREYCGIFKDEIKEKCI